MSRPDSLNEGEVFVGESAARMDWAKARSGLPLVEIQAVSGQPHEILLLALQGFRPEQFFVMVLNKIRLPEICDRPDSIFGYECQPLFLELVFEFLGFDGNGLAEMCHIKSPVLQLVQESSDRLVIHKLPKGFVALDFGAFHGNAIFGYGHINDPRFDQSSNRPKKAVGYVLESAGPDKRFGNIWQRSPSLRDMERAEDNLIVMP